MDKEDKDLLIETYKESLKRTKDKKYAQFLKRRIKELEK